MERLRSLRHRIGGVLLVRAYACREARLDRAAPLWTLGGHNLVVNAGIDYLLQTGSILGSTWYIGLLAGTPLVAATDTMAAHAGWTEIVAYAEAARQTWVGVRTGVGTADNSGTPATFTVNANGTTIGGVFLTSSNAKSGAVGTLYAGYAFSDGNRLLQSGNVLSVVYPLGDADDGIA